METPQDGLKWYWLLEWEVGLALVMLMAFAVARLTESRLVCAVVIGIVGGGHWAAQARFNEKVSAHPELKRAEPPKWFTRCMHILLVAIGLVIILAP